MGNDYPRLPESTSTVRLDPHSCVSSEPRRRRLAYNYYNSDAVADDADDD